MSNEEQKPTPEEVSAEVDSELPESETAAEPELIDEPADDDQVSQLQVTITQLEEALQEAKEQALRAAAEAQNSRRRAEQDVEKAHKFAVEKFANDMLPVADNLERAVAAFEGADEATKALQEGVELTLKTLIDALGRHKLEAVDPQGEPFDPQLHQAMSMIESPDVEPNTVINVFQKGYTLNGRLVRPAMVVVSKSGS